MGPFLDREGKVHTSLEFPEYKDDWSFRHYGAAGDSTEFSVQASAVYDERCLLLSGCKGGHFRAIFWPRHRARVAVAGGGGGSGCGGGICRRLL